MTALTMSVLCVALAVVIAGHLIHDALMRVSRIQLSNANIAVRVVFLLSFIVCYVATWTLVVL